MMPNGEIVENEGEKHLKVKTAEGEKFIVRAQLTDARKPLMSVSKVCDEGTSSSSAEKETCTLLRWTWYRISPGRRSKSRFGGLQNHKTVGGDK
jgi:hypothetical protein